MSSDKEQDQLTKLIELVQEALRQDEQLRQKYQVGEKFRFIRDRLQSLLAEVKEGPHLKQGETNATTIVQAEADETLVFVHLYNAQNGSIKNWQTIVTPKAFFDYSVNRPIYKEKKHIEEFIGAKTNRAQHGYLTVAVKNERILAVRDDLKDPMGHPLIKIKEGSLRCERMVSFTYNEHEYVLSEEGDLVNKQG